MIRQTEGKPAVRVPETGWAKAGRRRNRNPRTCVAAVADESAAAAGRSGTEGNIVRGED
jgi:hypothetical protein